MLAPVLMVLALSSSVPTLDVRRSCRGAQAVALPEDRVNAVKSCMSDEDTARRQLQAKWRQIPAEARTSCADEASTMSPSYVELLTCLEMRTGGNFSGGPTPPGPGDTPAPVKTSPTATPAPMPAPPAMPTPQPK